MLRYCYSYLLAVSYLSNLCIDCVGYWCYSISLLFIVLIDLLVMLVYFGRF